MNERNRIRDFETANPDPGTDPVARLRHTLDMYAGAPDNRMAVQATSGHYGGEPTGLTFGDLRALARLVGA